MCTTWTWMLIMRSLKCSPPLLPKMTGLFVSIAFGRRDQTNKSTKSWSLPSLLKLKNPRKSLSLNSEKTYNVLPPHWPFDHTIELKDSFVPKIAKVYPLNPAEKDACIVFLDEHLETGWIIPSKSPQASPFFFVPKKVGTLQPCQDYCYLNSHTICNVYPLPLIPELIDNMKESTVMQAA